MVPKYFAKGDIKKDPTSQSKKKETLKQQGPKKYSAMYYTI